eukprot:Pgem_evm1s10565
MMLVNKLTKYVATHTCSFRNGIRNLTNKASGCKNRTDDVLFKINNWIDNWIIKENLCPFAKPVRKKANAMRIELSNAQTKEDFKTDFENELLLISSGIKEYDN